MVTKTLNGLRVEPMATPGGNNAANQYLIHVPGKGVFFQSYNVIIAGRTPDGIVLDENYWDYSATTSKYRRVFLGEMIGQTRKKIQSGEYTLTDLNQ